MAGSQTLFLCASFCPGGPFVSPSAAVEGIESEVAVVMSSTLSLRSFGLNPQRFGVRQRMKQTRK